MPLVRIEIYKGKNREHKKAILDGVHNALVSAFKIPDDDRNQRLYELEEDDFERRQNKTNNYTIIEITAFKGRSVDAKRKLYKKIFQNLKSSPGISDGDITVYINEPDLQNWGIKGKSADEIDLGFEVKV
jgi:phenylpyruvate tautomerase PptA (4-oxalocrotonate tautomerase family)